MKRFLRISSSRLYAALLTAVLAMPVLAEDAYETVERVSAEVLDKVATWRDVFEEDPQKFYGEVSLALDDAVDYERMAFAVMDRDYYLAATPEQRSEFVEVFRRSLLETYAKGLLSVGNETIETVRPDSIDESATNVDVEQILHADADSYSIIYRMRANADGVWKLTNVTLEGINLGKTFRNQFQQAGQTYGGDVGMIIANWQVSDSEVED